MTTPTPIVWNDPNTAVELLGPLLNTSGYLDNVLVKCDPTSAHYQCGPAYRLARFSVDGNGQPYWTWIDADETTAGLPLHNAVIGWALAQ